MYRKIFIHLVLSLAIASLFLWLTINQMSTSFGDENPLSLLDSLLQSLRRVPVGVVLLYVFFFTAVHVLRIWRWKYLINPLGERDQWKLFRICSVGFAAIVILPLRLGEVVRPYMLARESKVPMIAALGSTVVERVLDGLVVTGMLFICLATYTGDRATNFVTGTGWISLAIFSGTLLMLILAAARHSWTERLIDWTLGRVSKKIAWKILHMIDSFLDGVRVLRKEHALSRFLGMTIVYWGLNAVAIAVLARGFGFEVSNWAGFTLLSILVIGIMIPSGPGFVGNFQFFLSQGMLLYASPALVAQEGFAFGLTLNAIQFAVQVLFGLPFFFISQMSVKKMLQADATPSTNAAETG